MLDFIKNHPFLVGWVLFVLLVYIYAYLDYAYYKYNFKDKVMHFYEALTEEEESCCPYVCLFKHESSNNRIFYLFIQ